MKFLFTVITTLVAPFSYSHAGNCTAKYELTGQDIPLAAHPNYNGNPGVTYMPSIPQDTKKMYLEVRVDGDALFLGLDSKVSITAGFPSKTQYSEEGRFYMNAFSRDGDILAIICQK